MNAKVPNISELDKQCADKNTLSVIVIRMFNTFNLKSAIKSIGLEKPGGRSVCALLQNLMLFRLYGESIFRSLFSGKSPDSGLHWVLDVIFREDACRAREGYAPQNLSVLRKIALHIVTNHKDKLILFSVRFYAIVILNLTKGEP